MTDSILGQIQYQTTRRAIVRSGIRLAYATPLVAASFNLATLQATAGKTVLSSDIADELDEEARSSNENPIAVPGEGFEVTDEDGDGVETVTVDGSSSADPDGKIVTYLWTLGGEWVSNEPVATVTLPIGTHRLQLTVTDDQGAEAKAKIRIRVKRGKAAAEPPVDEKQPGPDEGGEQPTPQPEVTGPPAPYQVEVVQKFAEAVVTWKVDPSVAFPFRIYRTIEDLTAEVERPIEELGWLLVREEWEKLSWRDAAVEVGVPYLYTVKSFDGVNESDFSNVAKITLVPVEETPAPPDESEEPVEDVPTEPAPEPTEPPAEEEPEPTLESADSDVPDEPTETESETQPDESE